MMKKFILLIGLIYSFTTSADNLIKSCDEIIPHQKVDRWFICLNDQVIQAKISNGELRCFNFMLGVLSSDRTNISYSDIKLSFRSSFFRFLFFLFAKNNVTLQNEIYFN